MEKTSSAATGSATAAAAAIAPLIDWLANGRFKWDMPSPVVLIVSAAAVTVGHLLVNRFNAVPAAPVHRVAPTRVTAEGGFARIAMLVALATVAAIVGGCVTAPRAEQLTPAQIAAQVCPAAQLTMASLSSLENLPPGARADIARAAPVVTAACAPATVASLSDGGCVV